jgi:hypothetical protein
MDKNKTTIFSQEDFENFLRRINAGVESEELAASIAKNRKMLKVVDMLFEHPSAADKPVPLSDELSDGD